MATALKSGVRVRGLQPEILLAVMIAAEIFEKRGRSLVVTSFVDGVHSENSLHYEGLAVDMRTRDMAATEQKIVSGQVKEALGECYDVVLEADHLHVELSPLGLKRRGD